MLVVEQDVAPQLIELALRVRLAVEHCRQRMEHLSRDGPLLGPPAQHRFVGAGCRAVFPPRAKVALHHRYLFGEVLLDIAEEVRRAAQDELGILPLGVPLLDDLCQPGRHALIIAEGPIDEYRVIGVIRPVVVRQQPRQPLTRLLDRADHTARHGIAWGDVAQHARTVRPFPIERVLEPLRGVRGAVGVDALDEISNARVGQDGGQAANRAGHVIKDD